LNIVMSIDNNTGPGRISPCSHDYRMNGGIDQFHSKPQFTKHGTGTIPGPGNSLRKGRVCGDAGMSDITPQGLDRIFE